MTDTRISNLSAGTPSTTDEGVYTNGTTTYKFDFQDAKNAVLNPGATTGQKLAVTASGQAGFINDDFVINYVIGGAGTTAISDTGLYPPIGIGADCTLASVELYSGAVAGVATLDIYKGDYSTPPTTAAQSIIGGGTKPTLAGTAYQSGIAWGTSSLSKGDVIAPYLSGVGTITQLTMVLYGTKTAVS